MPVERSPLTWYSDHMRLESEDIGTRLHEMLLLLQRRNRKSRIELKSELDPIDALTLSILVSVPNLTPSSLSRYLNFPPHRVSRLLAALTKRGLVKSERASNDGRSKFILFTATGRRAASEAEVVSVKLVKMLSAELSPKEVHDLLELVTALADDMCPFALVERDIVAALKRLTACMGMLSENYADTGMSLPCFQILFDLWRGGGACSFKELVTHFPLSVSSLSRECDSLQLRGLLLKKAQSSDRRSTSVSLTPEGSRLFLSHHARIGERLLRATRFLDIALRDRGLAVLTKVAQEPPKRGTDTEPLQIMVCESVGQRQRARGFLVEELVRSRQHLTLDSHLLPSKHTCFAITSGNVIRAVVEFAPGTGKTRSLKRVVCDGTLDGNHLRGIFREISKGGRVDPHSVKSAQVIPATLRESVLAGLTKASRD